MSIYSRNSNLNSQQKAIVYQREEREKQRRRKNEEKKLEENNEKIGKLKFNKIKIYRQYTGYNSDAYYFTFNEHDVNAVGRYPIEMPLTKENIVLTILDNQVVMDENGHYYGHQYFTTKTEGMKIKKDKLFKILQEVFSQWKEVNNID